MEKYLANREIQEAVPEKLVTWAGDVTWRPDQEMA